MSRNLIFDFDGTLADTLDLAVNFGNANQARFAARSISKEEFRSLSMREALQRIGLPLHRLPFFVRELKRHLKDSLSQVQIFPGVAEALERLRTEGNELYIMSSNSEEAIRGVLKRYGLGEHFRAVYSDSSIFGKQRVLGRMLRELGLEKGSSIYVGDEVRDFEACRSFGLEMIAVSWGWDDHARLERAEIPRIAASPEELVALLAPPRT